MKIHYGGANPSKIEAALSSLPTLLSLKETNKRPLPFLILGAQSCIYDNPWDRWDVPQVTDLVRPLILRMNSGVKNNVTPVSLGLKCSLRLPAEAMIRRKTVSRSKA